jgi:hypothetical protein
MPEPSDTDLVIFPDPSEITPHALAFARLMFVHASFERQICALQEVITKEPGFGEQRSNQWGTRERSARMVKLIEERLGKELPQTEQIAKLLTDAIDPCEQRNLLAHGTWWCFNRQASTIVVRSGTRWEHPDIPPEHRDYTAPNILALAEKLATIEVELDKLRRSLEPPRSDAEILSTFGVFRVPPL